MALLMSRHEPVVGDDEGFTRERVERLVRVYHSARYAAEAVGIAQNSMARIVRRHNLQFRQKSRDDN